MRKAMELRKERDVPASAGSSAGRSVVRGRAVRLQWLSCPYRRRRLRRGSRASFCRFRLRGRKSVLLFSVFFSFSFSALSLSLSLSPCSLSPTKRVRTNHGLRVLGARRPEAKLAQRRPRLDADGVEAALGRLQAALGVSARPRRRGCGWVDLPWSAGGAMCVLRGRGGAAVPCGG